MFSKRCTLSYKNKDTEDWKVLGMGVLKICYDSDLYGSRIEMIDDSGEQLSNTIIAVNTVLKVNNFHLFNIVVFILYLMKYFSVQMEDTYCIWRSMEWNLEPAVPRILKAQFSSAAAAQEMYYNYEESLQYAQQSEIVDTLPEENS